MLRISVTRIRVRPDGFVADDARLGRVEASWSEVRAIRKGFAAHRIDLHDGRSLSVRAGRAAFVINHRMQRLSGGSEDRGLRRAIIIAVIGTQVLGLAAVGLQLSGHANFRGGVIGAYLYATVLLATPLALQWSLSRSFTKIAQWFDKRRRTRARSERSGRTIG